MSCDGCAASGARLFEVFESSWKGYTRSRQVSELQKRRLLCGQCLVEKGTRLPAYRPTTGKWQMGRVTYYNSQTLALRLQFETGVEETVSVSSRPFSECVSSSKLASQDKKEKKSLDTPKPKASAPTSPSRDDGGIIWLNGTFSFVGDNQAEEPNFENVFNDSPSADSLEDSWMPAHNGREADGLNCKPTQDDEKTADSILSSKRHPGAPEKGGPGVSTKKLGTRQWSEEEDQSLLKSISKCEDKTFRLKWPAIAKAVHGRTGKQCRERYLNHLQPNLRGLKLEWTPTEDALIFHHYMDDSFGWSQIAKLLRGRSDNAVKNRYHCIRRKLDKLVLPMCKDPTSDKGNENQEMLRAAVDIILRTRSDPEMALSVASEWQYDFEFIFGHPVSSQNAAASVHETVCQRCGLLVPSPQTGRSVCRRTGWCVSCARAPPFLSENHLRRLHSANFAGNY